jgi:DNA-binding NarL/FixJ family response regulator
MTFPAPPLEGFTVVVQHQPDIATRLQAALSQAGATVFLASTSGETIDTMKRYATNLVVMDVHDAGQVPNEQVAFAAFHREDSACICYSRTFPRQGFITLAKWVDGTLPVSAIVAEATAYRTRMKV